MSPLYPLARSFRVVESAFNPKFKFRKTSFAWTPAIVGLLLLSASVLPVSGQTQFFWRGDGGLTGNWNANNTWWNGAEAAAGFGQLNFDNTAYPNGTNDTSFDTFRIYIAANSTVARTTNGTATVGLYDFSALVPIIRNDSTFLNTFNQNFSVGNTNEASGRAVQLVAAAGDLTFGGTWSTVNTANVTRELDIRAGSGRTITLSGQVTQVNASNNLQLRISDNGTVILNGSNNYTGTTFFERGILLLGNNSALGTSTLQFQFEIGDFRTLASSNSTARTITNNINVFNNLTLGQSSGGTGSLTLGGTFYLGDEPNQNRIVNFVGDHTISGNITGARGLVKQGTGTMTISGSGNTQTGTLFIDQGIVNINTASLSNSFIDVGAGSTGQSPNNAILRFSLPNTYSSNLTVKNFEGLGGTRTIDFANTSGTATLSGSVNLEKAATVSVAAGGVGNISGAVTGSHLITKSGGGTLRFNNNVAGPVTVTEGTLGGNTTIGGLTTLNSGATLAPGNSIGTMNFSAGLTLNSTSTVRMDISSTNGSADRINVTGGTLTYAGNLVFDTVSMTGVTNNTYTLFSGAATGTWATVVAAGTYSGAFIPNGTIWTRNAGDGNVWTYDQNAGTLTVIPEPSTWALIGVGSAFVLWRLRRRRDD
jgi:autotransporter-associated beta strand protein